MFTQKNIVETKLSDEFTHNNIVGTALSDEFIHNNITQSALSFTQNDTCNLIIYFFGY